MGDWGLSWGAQHGAEVGAEGGSRMSPARGPVQTPEQSRQAEARAAATNSQRQRLPPALIKSPLTSSAPSPGAWLDSEPVITADKELSEWSCGPQPPPCTGAQPGDTPGQGAPRSRRHPSLWRVPTALNDTGPAWVGALR